MLHHLPQHSRILNFDVLVLLITACGAPGAGSSGNEAKVGFAFSQTGTGGVYGETQKNGVELAIEEINAAAGTDGIKISAIYEDDASTPQQGTNVFRKLINQDQVSLIIGPTLSNTAKTADVVAQQAKVPVLGVSNTAGGVTEIGDYIFRNSLTDSVVIPNTVKTAKERLGLKKVALMYGNDDAFTQAGYEVFKKALADEGIEVTSEQTFAKGDRDFSAQLTQIKGQNPDAIVVSALAPEGAQIISQARQLGIPTDVEIIGGNGFNSPAIIQNAGAAAEGVIVGAAWNASAETPANRAFVDAYTKKYGKAPDQFAAQAYAGVKIAHEAMKKANSTDRTAIRDALAGIKDLDTVLGKFSFTEGRDASHEPVVQHVQNGKFVIFGE